jgi:serine/threonine protein kinase
MNNGDNSDFYQVKNYNIKKTPIGRGQSAFIYEGIEIYTNVRVAVKEIKDKNSEKYQSLIKGEIEIMKTLKHQNVVNLYDVVQSKDCKSIYVILELSTIGDFHNWLNGKCLKEEHCKNYMRQLVNGLSYLHGKGIIHRDLKPQNILMFDGGRQIKITDFGFAKFITQDVMSQTFCGSPLYMAPEIWFGKSYDYRVDIWSLGSIMYEMLTSQHPFHSKGFNELTTKIKNGHITFPKRISGKCLDLLKGLLEINPDKRISWDNIINHPWFEVDDLLINENRLLDFSITNSMSLSSLPSRNSTLGSIFNHQDELNRSFKNFSFHLTESQNKIGCSPPRVDIQMAPIKSIKDVITNDNEEEEEEDKFYSINELINQDVIEDINHNKTELNLKKDIKDIEFSFDIRDIFESTNNTKSSNNTYLINSQNDDFNNSHFSINDSKNDNLSSSEEIIIEETGDKFVYIKTTPININQSNLETRKHKKINGIFDSVRSSVRSFAKDSYDYISDQFKSI